VSTVSVVVRAVPLAVVLALAALLARSALALWSRERAGRPYELATDYRPALLRGVAALLVLVLGGTVVALALPGPGTQDDGVDTAGTARSAVRPAGHHRGPHRHYHGRPAPAAERTAAVTDGRTAPVVLAAPAGGSLRRFADGTRVWLPPQYAYPSAAHLAFPVVVAYLPGAPPYLEELYPAFARQVALGRADPFVVVEPAGCGADPAAAVAEAARHFRLLTAPAARGVLGVGDMAPCAVRAGLARPGAFGGYVGVSGRYDGGAVRLPAARSQRVPLLLTTAWGEPARRESAYRLRDALRGVGTEARIIDAVRSDPLAGGGRRGHELGVAAQYFTERLAGPSRVDGR
jgi:hypothetical protein